MHDGAKRIVSKTATVRDFNLPATPCPVWKGEPVEIPVRVTRSGNASIQGVGVLGMDANFLFPPGMALLKKRLRCSAAFRG